jgi:hypothetical protein
MWLRHKFVPSGDYVKREISQFCILFADPKTGVINVLNEVGHSTMLPKIETENQLIHLLRGLGVYVDGVD